MAKLTAAPGADPQGGGSSNGADAGKIPTYKDAETHDASMIQYVTAWALVLILLLILNRSKWGHALIYYGLALSLLLLVLVNYQAITTLLAPAGSRGVHSGDEPGHPVPEETTQEASPTRVVSGRAPRFQVST